MITWTTRKGTPVSDGERVYFFKKAYERFVKDGCNRFPAELIASIEQELGINHTDSLKNLLNAKKNLGTDVDDFCNTEISSLLETMRSEVLDSKDKQAFVDLCVMLNKSDVATDFANTHHEQYDILQSMKKSEGTVRSKLLAEAVPIVMDSDDTNRDASRLTSIVYNCIDAEHDQLCFSLAELWGEGYHWDSLCLAKLLCPNAPITDRFKSQIQNYVRPTVSNQVHKIVELLELIRKDGTALCYKDNLLNEVEPVDLYRILKCDILRNEKSNSRNELQKLIFRDNNSNALRDILLSAYLSSNPSDAQIIAQDAVLFIKNLQEAFADYFKGTEKLLFGPSIGMIGDMIAALLFIMHRKHYALFENTNEYGVISIVRNNWKKHIAQIFFEEEGELYRNSFRLTCTSLLGRLDSIKQHMTNIDASKMSIVKLAIDISLLLISMSGSSDAELHANIESVAQRCGFSPENAKKLTEGLFRKPNASSRSDNLSLEPAPIVSDHGTHFTNELQSNGIQTKWEHSPQVIRNEINPSGDGHPVNALNSESNVTMERARLILGMDKKYQLADKEPPKVAEKEVVQSSAASKNSSLSSIAGSASNYAEAGSNTLDKLVNKSLISSQDYVQSPLVVSGSVNNDHATATPNKQWDKSITSSQGAVKLGSEDGWSSPAVPPPNAAVPPPAVTVPTPVAVSPKTADVPPTADQPYPREPSLFAYGGFEDMVPSSSFGVRTQPSGSYGTRSQPHSSGGFGGGRGSYRGNNPSRGGGPPRGRGSSRGGFS